MLATRADDCAAALAFCNLVGGQDELVFDGRSALFDASGELLARAPQFTEDLLVADVDLSLSARRRLREPLARRLPAPPPGGVTPVSASPGVRNGGPPARATLAPALRGEEEVWSALSLGLRDYVDKNGFPGVILGLSGGIDSALTAAIAADALGPERVTGVALPSVHSSPESLAGAQALSESLAIRLIEVSIADVVGAFEEALAESLDGAIPGVAGREPPGPRARHAPHGASPTLAGTWCSPPATRARCRWATARSTATWWGASRRCGTSRRPGSTGWPGGVNASEGREVIPEATIRRPPTAELRPGQLDTDSLPPYDLLDAILEGYVEQNLEPAELVLRGYPEDIVADVVRMVDRAEYKRRQGPVGIKITPRAFGRDRRMPITTRHV